MSLWDDFRSGLGGSSNEINPASGLPMNEGSMFDVAGNAWGTDSSDFGMSDSTGMDSGIGGDDFGGW